jgi:TPR repeat protein
LRPLKDAEVRVTLLPQCDGVPQTISWRRTGTSGGRTGFCSRTEQSQLHVFAGRGVANAKKQWYRRAADQNAQATISAICRMDVVLCRTTSRRSNGGGLRRQGYSDAQYNIGVAYDN